MDTMCRDDEAGYYQAGFKLVRLQLLPTAPFRDLLLPSPHSNMAPFSQIHGTPFPKCVSPSPCCAVSPAPSIPHAPVPFPHALCSAAWFEPSNIPSTLPSP
ncbi:hypothetical protein M405DRAFT_868112 [Rhizopogon salebrosus TDB-379]|nr:hypothetical protein M405DRAFT_868112 [Rhizopogon salebrosus TDB-379]